jgi:hypothetical protein
MDRYGRDLVIVHGDATVVDESFGTRRVSRSPSSHTPPIGTGSAKETVGSGTPR